MAAPIGNTNATKNKPWAEALARVNKQSDGAKMRALAEKVWEMALAGDGYAIREIGERHDGKATQEMDVTHRGGLAEALSAIGSGKGSNPPVA